MQYACHAMHQYMHGPASRSTKSPVSPAPNQSISATHHTAAIYISLNLHTYQSSLHDFKPHFNSPKDFVYFILMYCVKHNIFNKLVHELRIKHFFFEPKIDILLNGF